MFLPKPTISKVTLLAINDVYELEPTAGRGGLSRFATYAKELYDENPSGFLTCLPGDFYSPSALGFAPVKDKDGQLTPFKGKQMVDMFNYVAEITKYREDEPSLIATYGNHEFDVKEADFLGRLAESEFPYISSNVHGANYDLQKTIPHLFLVKNNVTFLFLGVTTDMAQPSYIKIDPFDKSVDDLKTILTDLEQKKKQWDVLVALTHWNLEDDIELASLLPRIDIIMGGHEHENWYLDRGSSSHPVIISKADSNAKTVFKHEFTFDRTHAEAAIKDMETKNPGSGEKYRYGTAYHTGALQISSYLKSLDDSVKFDKTLDARIEDWTQRGYEAYKASNIDPSRVMAFLPKPMIVLDKIVRHYQNEVTTFCASALEYSTRLAGEDISPGLFNTGSLRIDDTLPEGATREYDALRMWPFGGEVVRINIYGDLLRRVLGDGVRYTGSGDYLGYDPTLISLKGGVWYYKGSEIVDNKQYHVSVLEYMIGAGKDTYFYEDKQGTIDPTFEIVELPAKVEAQQALIQHFERVYPITPEQLSATPLYDVERITPFPRFKF